MKKIVLIRGEACGAEALEAVLGLVFPECEIQVVEGQRKGVCDVIHCCPGQGVLTTGQRKTEQRKDW